jgi:hypothetical protein
MKLLNKTSLYTKQLKAFIRAVAKHEGFTPEEIKSLMVRAIYRKRSRCWEDNFVTGYAYYKKPNMCLKFVKGVMPDKVQMAKTVAHELAHIQGVHHGKAMKNSLYGWKDGWREHWAWADSLPLTMNTPEDKKPERSEVVLDKVTHCLKMIIVWEKKAKIAKTKQKKWARKLAYYQKQGQLAAVQAPEQESNETTT